MPMPENPIDYLKTVPQTAAVVAMMRLLSIMTPPDSVCPADNDGVEDWTDLTAEWSFPDGSCVMAVINCETGGRVRVFDPMKEPTSEELDALAAQIEKKYGKADPADHEDWSDR